MHYGFNGFGGWGMILFWVILGAVIFLVLKVLLNSFHHESTRTKGPLDILKQRYASGEISREEYQRKKHDLTDR